MKLLYGKDVAKKINDQNLELSQRLYKKYNKKPCIAVLGIAGSVESDIYVKKIEQKCKKFNIDVISLIALDETQFIRNFKKIRNDDRVTAVMFQQPLSKDLNQLINEIDSYKDVEGISKLNMGKLFLNQDTLIPCTANAVKEILDFYNIDIASKKAVVVGRSNIVGKPVSMLLLNNNATVTICHSRTVNLEDETKTADILVVAIGKANYITSKYIKKGAIVIDIGINYYNNKIVGDVDFDDVKDIVSMITPVPGGVGIVTSALLISNILKSFKLQME